MIYVLWPTARPEVFINRHYNDWLCKADSYFKTIVVVDSNQDKQSIRNTKLKPLKISEDYYQKCEILISDAKTPGVAKPCHLAARHISTKPDDIIILASDDFSAPPHWDTWIKEQGKDYKGCLWVNDGFKPGGTITIPILTHDCLETLNRTIYHPSYNHEWSDAELYDILKELELLKDLRPAPNLIFKHNHWACGDRKQDEVDLKCRKMHNIDQRNYMLRKHLSIKEKLQS